MADLSKKLSNFQEVPINKRLIVMPQVSTFTCKIAKDDGDNDEDHDHGNDEVSMKWLNAEAVLSSTFSRDQYRSFSLL